MGIMTTATISTYYCTLCEAVKTIAYSFNKFFETAGTARAAAELTRMGYHKEAQALMMDLKK